MHTDWSSLSYFNCDDFVSHLIKTYQFTLNKLEYFIRPLKKNMFSELLAFWKVCSFTYMHSILGRGSFCFNYCLNSAWHGGDQFVALLRWYEAQVSLTVAFSSSAFFGLLFLIFLLTIPRRFSMFRSGEFAGQSSTPTPWSFNQLLVLLAVWAGAKSCWKMKSASLKSWSAEGSISAPKFLGKRVQWSWFSKNTMDQHQQMTLLPKSSQTVET